VYISNPHLLMARRAGSSIKASIVRDGDSRMPPAITSLSPTGVAVCPARASLLRSSYVHAPPSRVSV
jgi:hypothetical protein